MLERRTLEWNKWQTCVRLERMTMAFRAELIWPAVIRSRSNIFSLSPSRERNWQIQRFCSVRFLLFYAFAALKMKTFTVRSVLTVFPSSPPVHFSLQFFPLTSPSAAKTGSGNGSSNSVQRQTRWGSGRQQFDHRIQHFNTLFSEVHRIALQTFSDYEWTQQTVSRIFRSVFDSIDFTQHFSKDFTSWKWKVEQ